MMTRMQPTRTRQPQKRSYTTESDSSGYSSVDYDGQESQPRQAISPGVAMESPISLKDVNGDARKRVKQACDYCRTKKCKCTGDDPCSKCQELNLYCSFTITDNAHDSQRSYTNREYNALFQRYKEVELGFTEFHKRAAPLLSDCPLEFSKVIPWLRQTSKSWPSASDTEQPSVAFKKPKIRRATRSGRPSRYDKHSVVNNDTEPQQEHSDTPPGLQPLSLPSTAHGLPTPSLFSSSGHLESTFDESSAPIIPLQYYSSGTVAFDDPNNIYTSGPHEAPSQQVWGSNSLPHDAQSFHFNVPGSYHSHAMDRGFGMDTNRYEHLYSDLDATNGYYQESFEHTGNQE